MFDAHPGSAGVLACAVFPVSLGFWFVAFFPDRFGFILEDVSVCLGRGPQQVLAQPADGGLFLGKDLPQTRHCFGRVVPPNGAADARLYVPMEAA